METHRAFFRLGSPVKAISFAVIVWFPLSILNIADSWIHPRRLSLLLFLFSGLAWVLVLVPVVIDYRRDVRVKRAWPLILLAAQIFLVFQVFSNSQILVKLIILVPILLSIALLTFPSQYVPNNEKVGCAEP